MQVDVDRGKSSEGDDPVQTHSCSKCGREFVGNYCLECGQATSRELSTTEVISESVREFIDVEREFWKTPKALMIRPGTALQAYLSGARGCPISPGRYLLVAVVICYGVDQALTWIGGRASLSDQASGRVSEGTSALIREVRVAAWRVFGSQGARIAVNLLLVGLRSLVLWRLFRTKLDRGAEVLTLGGVLDRTCGASGGGRQGSVCTVGVSGYGEAAEHSNLLYPGLCATYVGWVTYGCGCVGPDWKSAGRGLLGLG